MIMKKKFSFSAVTVYMIALALILVGYLLFYFVPARAEIRSLKSQISLSNAEAATYKKYLTDSTLLEADIQSIQDEIERLHTEGYVSNSTVNFEISNAIQLYNISLNSVALDSVTTIKENKALPISLSLTGKLEDVLGFIRYFEQNKDGSYMVASTSIKISGPAVSTSIVIYLLTPNV